MSSSASAATAPPSPRCYEGVCFGCHMNILPQQFIDLQKGVEILQCPHCQRILYWQEEEAEGDSGPILSRDMGGAGSRAAIFRALAEGLDLARVRERFGLSAEDLRDIFREAADYYARSGGRGLVASYCDGASRGNPGPAGAGVVLFDPGRRGPGRNGGYLGETTNNVAEYQALLLGLKRARDLGVKKIQVSADSELLVRQLNGHYRVKAPTSSPLAGSPAGIAEVRGL